MKSKNSKKYQQLCSKILRIAGFSILIAGLGLIIYGSIEWCHYIDLFAFTTFDVQGNRILSSQDILALAGVEESSSTLSVNPAPLQERLEQSPYIRAASVSREFPNCLRILVDERQPLCYLSHKELVLLDREGIVLPLPKKSMKTNLPVISGFEKDSLLYTPGVRAPNPNVLEIVAIIRRLSRQNPDLFTQISELHQWQNGRTIVYTIDGGTPIFLGERDLEYQLYILAEFQETLQGKQQLSDFQYLDLRWRHQIVAKKKRT